MLLNRNHINDAPDEDSGLPLKLIDSNHLVLGSTDIMSLRLIAICLISAVSLPVNAADPIDIGSRLELFVDDHLIDRLDGVELQLHKPTPRELALDHGAVPWEGGGSSYHTVFQDGDIYRMYYRGTSPKGMVTCYAESRDGIHWLRPELGIVAFNGSKKNNIVWPRTPNEIKGNGTTYGIGTANFFVFKDTNPKCHPAARYKALGQTSSVLSAFKSPDGIQWSPLRHIHKGEKIKYRRGIITHDEDCPGWSSEKCRRAMHHVVITDGEFDSLNVAFWDHRRNCYVAFCRESAAGMPGNNYGQSTGYRSINTLTSPDFIHWSKGKLLKYGDVPKEELYTNSISLYPRAPHIYVGFPMRFLGNLQRSDGLFMTSRDGQTFHRWLEAFLRPGLQKSRWHYTGAHGNNSVAHGIVITKSNIPETPDEMSIYSVENYGHPLDKDGKGPGSRLRRFTQRMDGFVSVHAQRSGGEFVTKPLEFSGKQLVVNFSTSAVGRIQIEIQNADGKPLPGYRLKDFHNKHRGIFGDEIGRVVAWKGNADISRLSGQPVRLRFVLKDADLYSFQFRN